MTSSRRNKPSEFQGARQLPISLCVQPRAEGEPLSHKRFNSSFEQTALEEELANDRGVDPMSPIRMAQLESAIRVVLEFNAAFNRHDVAAMMRRMSDDCVFENTAPAPDGAVYAGKEAVTRFWLDFFRESPHAHIEIEEIFGLGLRCVMRWRYDWIDAAGEKGHIRGVDIFQLKGGFICQKLSYVKG